MNEYVIIGTSHEIQDTSSADDPVRKAASKHAVILITEEYPFKCQSRVRAVAENMRIPYLQIDPFPEDWAALGIEGELKMREQFLPGRDIRLSHADAVREDFWLKRIDANLSHGRVLIVCGYLHIDFLAEKVEKRGGAVLEKSTFPAELLHRKPEIVLDPAELEDFLRKLHEGRPYSDEVNSLASSGGTETR